MSTIQKSKYKPFYNKKFNKKASLNVNLKGFLCSCNNREKECIREAYNLLNKYADKLYPPVVQESSKDENIEDELKAELNELKTNNQRDVKRFQVLESGAKNFLFISTTVEDPVKLADMIVSDIEATKNQQSRFLIRLVPIEITCKANIKDIEVAFKPLAEKYFKENARKFSIVYNHRNNNSLNRDELIKVVANVVSQMRSDNTVDLKAADVSIIIEVIKGIALIGVIPNFIKYKKYNLLLISGQNEDNIECPKNDPEVVKSETPEPNLNEVTEPKSNDVEND